jgi:hypothetical protein
VFQQLFSYPQNLFPILRPRCPRLPPQLFFLCESLGHGFRAFFVAYPHERDQSAITIDYAVYNKLPLLEFMMAIDSGRQMVFIVRAEPHRCEASGPLFALEIACREFLETLASHIYFGIHHVDSGVAPELLDRLFK